VGAFIDLYHAPNGWPFGAALVAGPEQPRPSASHRPAQNLQPVKASLTILLASALYGFSGGSIDGMDGAVRSLVKFPLLIFLISVLCSLAWWLMARFLACRLSLRTTISTALRAFADASLMLAALAPVNLFLSRTMVLPPDISLQLNEYPLFLGLNVAFVAICGTMAVVRQVRLMQKTQGVSLRKTLAVALAWLSIGLFVGGQCSWYLCPFYGNRAAEPMPFILGTQPDSRGATSFYEGVYNLLQPPPLPENNGRKERTIR
jgi:hypothetical protein